MLQQTRVDTVKPYYARFLERFPTVRHLSDAPEGDVLAAWSGLGYYRRARMLHAGAKAIAARPAFPASREALLEVPGIGPYTAGAVASIAFGEAVELVDGNVARVLARLFGLEDDVKSVGGQRVVWAVAKRELRRESPGEWNQALMELGATVCTPKKPACELCPVTGSCVARAQGRVDVLPLVGKKKPPREEARTALVLRDAHGVWLGERARDQRFGGMWEPPMLDGHVPAAEVGARFRELLGSLPRELRTTECGIVVHVLSHRRMSVKVYCARIDGARAPSSRPSAGGEYVRFERRPDGEPDGTRGTSTLAQKVLASASASVGQES